MIMKPMGFLQLFDAENIPTEMQHWSHMKRRWVLVPTGVKYLRDLYNRLRNSYE